MNRFHCLLQVVLLAGCTGSRTSPVEGDVRLDGKPLPNASIHFVPQGTGRDATGTTDQNGHFVMSTFNPKDGVVAGEYKIVISPPAGSAEPTRYASAEEAMAAAAKSPPKTDTSFPQEYTRADQTPLSQKVPVEGQLTIDLKSK